MSVEENKALIRRFIDGFNKGTTEFWEECFADSFVNYRTDGMVMDRDGYKKMCTMLKKNSSDVHITLDETIAEGKRLAFRFTIEWTDKAGFMGKPPSGKRISMSEAYFVGFKGNKISEFRNFQAQPRRE
jgi:predicted ester cyclase